MRLGAEDGRLRLLGDVRDVGHVVVVTVVHEDRIGRAEVTIDHGRLDHQLGLGVRALGGEGAGLEASEPGVGEYDVPAGADLPCVRAEPPQLDRLPLGWSCCRGSGCCRLAAGAVPITPVAPTAAAPVSIPLRLNLTLSPLAVPGSSVKARALGDVEYALAHVPIVWRYRRRSAGSC